MEKTLALQHGQEIRNIRIRTGLSQKDFAKLLRCPMRTLQDWEAGRREIPLYELHWLKIFMDVEEEDFRFILYNTPEFAGLDLKVGWKKYVELYY